MTSDPGPDCPFLSILTAAHVWEAGEEEGEEEVEEDEVAHEDGGHEVGDAGAARHEDAVPHGLYPLTAQHTEHDHEAGTQEGSLPTLSYCISYTVYCISAVLFFVPFLACGDRFPPTSLLFFLKFGTKF